MRMRLPPHHRRDNQTKNHRHRNRPSHDELLLAVEIASALTRQQIKAFALAGFFGFKTEHNFVLPRAAPRDKPRACGACPNLPAERGRPRPQQRESANNSYRTTEMAAPGDGRAPVN